MAKSHIHISTGFPGSGDGGAFEDLLERLDRPRPDYLILVPGRRVARLLVRKAIERRSGCFRGPRVETLDDFAISAASELEPGLSPLRDIDRLFFFADILADDSHSWRSFRRQQADFPGMVRAVADAVKALRAGNVSPEIYAREARHDGAGKAHDIALAYHLYDRFLEEREFLDTERAYRLVAEASAEKLKQGSLGDLDRFWLLGFYDLTGVQSGCVKKLATVAGETRIVVDFTPERPRVFAPVEGILSLFPGATRDERAGGSEVVRRLFAPPETSCRVGDAVGLMTTRTRVFEVEAIAAEIKRLVLAEDTPLHKIAVTFANSERYAPLVREIFPRYGLEFNVARGFALIRSPAAAVVFNMLEAVANGYKRREITTLFRSPYVSFEAPGADGQTIEVSELDAAAREAGIIDGRRAWSERLRAQAAKYAAEAEAIHDGDYDSESSDDREEEAQRRARRAAGLEDLALLVERVLGELSCLEKRGTVADFCGRVRDLIDIFHLRRESVPAETHALALIEIEKDLRALQRLERILDELASADGDVRGGAPRQIELADFIDLLRAAVTPEQFQVRTWDDAGVQVMGIDDTRGLRFRHLFVIGLLQGEFPSGRRVRLFLPDDLATRCNLPGRMRDECEDRYHFLRLLATADRVVLSWPQSDGDEPLVRSPYLDELEEHVEDLLVAAPATPVAAVGLPGDGDEPRGYSRDRLIRWIGGRLSRPLGADAAVVRALADDDTLGLLIGQLRRNMHIDADRAAGLPGPHTGRVMAADVRRAISSRFGPEHRFSVSQFDRYGSCPFAFFMSEVLGLEKLEEPEEEVSPLTRGGIIHEMLRCFYTGRRRDGKGRPAPTERAEARQLLCSHARRLFGKLPFDDLFLEKEIEAIVADDGLVDAFLEIETGADLHTRPRYFEFAFGKTSRMGEMDPMSQTPPLKLGDDVQVIGKIDRVDVADNGHVVVYDYKTGSAANLPDIIAMRSGLSFQLPIYMLAVRDGLNLTPVAGVYYHVRSGLECKPHVSVAARDLKGEREFPSVGGAWKPLLPSHVEIEALMEEVRDLAIANAKRIRGGEFPLTTHSPKEAGCRHCGFRNVCRLPEREG